VWHVLAICSVSSLGEQPLQGSEYVPMCSHRGADVLCAAVEVVAVDSEAFARAFVMFELGQVRQSQGLAVDGDPVLNYFRLIEVL